MPYGHLEPERSVRPGSKQKWLDRAIDVDVTGIGHKADRGERGRPQTPVRSPARPLLRVASRVHVGRAIASERLLAIDDPDNAKRSAASTWSRESRGLDARGD